MKLIVSVASALPILSNTSRANSAARFLSIPTNRCRLTTSIGNAAALPLSRLDADLPRVLIVSLDDHLHQLVAHHVLLVEVNEGDALDAADHALGFDQPGLAPRGQINLRHVARNNRL